ncbi:hypothetical protein [Streptomyces sp. NPDC017529]|uniref:hypothetical protein n=1 Tax=Streptomyces sp. NPDC017529 TaxID=3365000 RepID=UPI0037A439C3
MTMTAPTYGPVVIGIDPSLTATGIAGSNGWCDVVGWTKKPPITGLPHPERREALHEIRQLITDTIGRPDLAVMELPAHSRSGGGAHERGWLWWEIYNYLAALEVPTGFMSTGQRAMYATGKGNATKGAVIDAVARRWPRYTTNGDDNAADAITLMAAGRDWLGYPLTDMPKTHRKAIDNAVWPHLLGAAA